MKFVMKDISDSQLVMVGFMNCIFVHIDIPDALPEIRALKQVSRCNGVWPSVTLTSNAPSVKGKEEKSCNCPLISKPNSTELLKPEFTLCISAFLI